MLAMWQKMIVFLKNENDNAELDSEYEELLELL